MVRFVRDSTAVRDRRSWPRARPRVAAVARDAARSLLRSTRSAHVRAPVAAVALIAGALGAGATVSAPQVVGLEHYAREFLAALVLLDDDEPRAAAERFEAAGLEAPHAPVWLVHACDAEGTGLDSAEIWQWSPGGGMLAFMAEHGAPLFGKVFLLDGNARQIWARIELPGVAEDALAPGFGRPVFGRYIDETRSSGRSIVALSASTTPDRVFGLYFDSGTLAWTHVGDSHNGAPRELSVRGRRLYCHGGQAKSEVLDLGTGESLFEGATLGLHALDQIAGDGSPLGLGQDSVVVLDPASFDPLATVWLHDESLVVALEDGTFLLDSDALAEALVQVGDTRVPARLVAPWLLDPLHVRALAHDTDRSPRRFPVR